MARPIRVKVSKILFVRVGNPDNAVALYEYLSSNDFHVYDHDLAYETGNFVVYGSTFTKLRKAVQEARDYDLLKHPFKVIVNEIKEGKTAVATRKEDRAPSLQEAFSMFTDTDDE